MSPTLIATIAGLVTVICWGTSDWLSAKSVKKLRPVEVNFTVQIVSSILMLGLFLVSDIHMPSSGQLVHLGGTALCITVAYTLFVKALASGAVGIIAPIGNSYPLITVALSIILLNVALSLGQVGAMIAIVLGAAALAYEKNHQNIPLRELHRDTLIAVVAAVVWGVGFFLLDPVAGKITWQAMSVTIEVFMLPLALVAMLLAHGRHAVYAAKNALKNKAALIIGVAGTAGGVSLYVGSESAGSVLIPTVISAGGPLVASFLGAVFDNERIGIMKRLGAILLVAGIILLNLA